MASLDQAVRGALQSMAMAIPGMPPPGQIDSENIAFNATSGVPWARLTVQWTSSRPLGVNVSTKRHNGLLLVDLFYPANTGIAAAENLAAAVRNGFAAGSRISFDGVAPVIDYAERSRAMEQKPDWLMCPLTIGWHCFSTLN